MKNKIKTPQISKTLIWCHNYCSSCQWPSPLTLRRPDCRSRERVVPHRRRIQMCPDTGAWLERPVASVLNFLCVPFIVFVLFWQSSILCISGCGGYRYVVYIWLLMFFIVNVFVWIDWLIITNIYYVHWLSTCRVVQICPESALVSAKLRTVQILRNTYFKLHLFLYS